MKGFALIIISVLYVVAAQKDPNFAPNRHTIVHLFEWRWSDIAQECEDFLSKKGFGGVQISPPNENLIIIKDGDRPWWERYQPISYKLTTRSGTEAELADMIKRCNKVGVRIYVDTVINHMTGGSGTGTGNSKCDWNKDDFPGVPYGSLDFHVPCPINNYQDPVNVRNCELESLRDLDHSKDYVRKQITDYMNHLVSLGVAGFRVDAAKHMWPADLEFMFKNLNNLNTDHGFPKNARPFIYQEVIDMGGEAVKKQEYISFGRVLEFKYGTELGNIFQKRNPMKYLSNWGPKWGFLDGIDAVCFVDNHDNQRTGSDSILTYKKAKAYKMAIAFMLAHPYGEPRVMSSYAFDNKDQGPPMDKNQNIVGPKFNPDGSCTNGWVCEHRWRQIFNMVQFRNVVGTTEITNWWSSGDWQIAFGRGDKAFIAFTLQGDINQALPTKLPSGTYCDIISGELVNGKCTGKSVTVDSSGKAQISLKESEDDGVLAIHINAKI